MNQNNSTITGPMNNKKNISQSQGKSIDSGLLDSPQPSKRELWITLLIVIVLPILVYIPTVKYGFVNFDDDKIIGNHISFLSNFDNLPKVFMTDAFTDGSSKFYRPMQVASYMTDIKLSGGNSMAMYHISNLIFLAIISCLIYFLLRGFRIPSKVAGVGSVVYCLHPLFVSNIAWIPARGDLLLMLFSLLSFILFTDYLKNEKPLFLAGHLLTYTVALFCKETAVILPPLFILYYILFGYKDSYKKGHLLTLGLYILVGGIWFWIRSMALSGNLPTKGISDIVGSKESFGILSVLKNLEVLPASVSSFFIPVDIDLLPGFSVLKTITGSILLLAGVALIIKSKGEKRNQLLFFFAWFLLFLLPTMLYKHERIDYLQHRFFIPLVGILLFMFYSLPEKWFGKSNLLVAGIIFTAGLSVLTFTKARSFADPITFYNTAIKENPSSSFAFNNRGYMLMKQGKYADAFNDFSNAIKESPDFAQAYYNRGLATYLGGSAGKAIEDYTLAIKLAPAYTDAYTNRAIANIKLGQYDHALSDFDKAIELNPGNTITYCNRGSIYLDKGQYDRSISDCSKAISLNTGYAMAYFIRGESYRMIKKYDQALLDYSKALGIQNNFADAFNGRGLLFNATGEHDKACNDFSIASRLGSKEAKQNLITYCK